MKTATIQEIKKSFDTYKNIVFMVDVDLRFWQPFLSSSIREYQDKPSRPDVIFQAVFNAYNIDSSSDSSLLKTVKTAYNRKTVDLGSQSEDFFKWIMLLSMLKIYNSLEILLLQSIQIKSFPSLCNPIQSKKACDQLHQEIKKQISQIGIKPDTKNNRHLVDFFKLQSTKLKAFLSLPIRSDLTTSWEDFFELISILRNTVAHHGTIMTLDTYNAIKSKARDIFERHFELEANEFGTKNLRPKQNQFLNFLNYYNDFTVNLVKFYFDEQDLTFIGIT